MDRILYPQPVDLGEFLPGAVGPRRLYGLPGDVCFCKRCLYSNQKPNSEREYKHTRETRKNTVIFDEDGVCAACHVADEKQSVEWAERERQLVELCNRYRRNDGHYDCLVPGSGGKDSFYASHMLKYKYGMNPLTVTWAPHIYTDWGWSNFQAWIQSGFDNFLFTPNGRVHRLLTRLALEQLCHPFQPFIMGQMYLPPKMAIQHDIPLVFYGENPTEYGNPRLGEERAQKDWEYFSTEDQSQVHMAGVSLSDLQKNFGLSKLDIDPYMPPDPEALKAHKVEVHYLGYYLKWHPQSCYYYSVEHGDFQAAPERSTGTYSKYSSIDDKIDDLHYYTTFVKFGMGRATYDASQEIRSRDITREEGLYLVKRYDGEYPTRFEAECFKYLSLDPRHFPVAAEMFEQPIMDRKYFEGLINRFRSPHLWQHVDGQWSLRRTPWEGCA